MILWMTLSFTNEDEFQYPFRNVYKNNGSKKGSYLLVLNYHSMVDTLYS